MQERNTVLVIEDDSNIVDLLTIHLTDAGFDVESASTGTDGLELAMAGSFGLIVLDLMLPGIDGLSICRKVRQMDQYTPIMMLTARSEEMDKIIGLELGADDYMTKPFSPRELTARVKALVRRVRELDPGARKTEAAAAVRIGDLTIDQEKHRVFLRGSEIDLTAKEYDLITLLATHPGQAFNREQLLDRVWHYQHEGYNHTVNSHINRLRAKVETDPSNPEYIRTVWGYGYRFSEPTEFGDASQ